jgi:hypothetical protein
MDEKFPGILKDVYQDKDLLIICGFGLLIRRLMIDIGLLKK